MSTPDRAELQRIAQTVNTNRKRMEALEQQIDRLEQIRIEQVQTIETLAAIPPEGAKGAMIPLGSGVQIIADIPSNPGVVIDIGSRVQAEKTLSEAFETISERGEELSRLIENLTEEFNNLEQETLVLANIFNEQIAELQGTEPELFSNADEEPPPSTEAVPIITESKPKRRKRKRGTEFTLDD
jgi:prefoldin alpha subunit